MCVRVGVCVCVGGVKCVEENSWLASQQISEWNTNKNNIHPSQKQRGDAVKSRRAPLCACACLLRTKTEILVTPLRFPPHHWKLRCASSWLTSATRIHALQGRDKGDRRGSNPPPLFPLPVYSNHQLLKWEVVSSQKMTGIVIHKGPKPLIPSMTESAGEVGVGEGALWIPDEFNQGGSISPGRGEGEERRRGGGQGRLILKGFLPPAAPVFLSEHLFFSIPPSLSFIYLSFSVFTSSLSFHSASLHRSITLCLLIPGLPQSREGHFS